jgi:hypothetical protein
VSLPQSKPSAAFGAASHPPEKKAVSGVERAVTNLICAWVVILPWLIGARFWWVQALSVVVGGFAFFLAVRSADNRRTLWRFPIFWLGLLFLGYIACQALNPWAAAVQRKPGINVWDVSLHSHLDWLPAGISADFTQMSTWRMLVYWAGPWLLVCAWWAAVRRRRSGQRLALIVFLNGIATALVVLIEGFHAPTKILGVYFDPAFDPNMTQELTTSAGFVNHNAAAAFLYLSLGAGLAVACRLQARAREEARDSGLTWVALMGCLMMVASFFTLGSRTGLVIACVLFVLGFGVMLAATLFSGGRSPGLWVGGLVILLAVGGLVAHELRGSNSSTLSRWQYLSDHPELDTRAVLRFESKRMLQPHFWLGWGAGSYRYTTPPYFYADNFFQSSKAIGGSYLWTDNAHCDWLQLPVEYGVLGAGLALAMLLYWYGYALWLARKLGAAGIVVLLATLGMLAHAAVDFPIFNAAVLALFSMLLASTVKTAELSDRRRAK